MRAFWRVTSRSVRSYLVVLVLGVSIPLLVFALLQTRNSAEYQRQLIENQIVDNARTAGVSIDKEVQATIAALTALAASGDLDTGNLRSFYESARRASENQPWYTVWLADTEGRHLLNLVRPYGAELPSVAERDYFQRVMETRKLAISRLNKGRLTSGYHIAVAVPVIRDNKIRYVLTAGFRPERLSEILAMHHPENKNGIASIVDRDYTILARTREPAKWIGSRAAEGYIKAVQTKPYGLVKTATVDEKMVYVAFTTLPTTGWIVGAGVPASDFEAPLKEAIQGTALLGLLLLLASLIAALLAGRRIARPITALAHAAGDIADGRPVTPGDHLLLDEIGTLAHALQKASEATRERNELVERERKALREADAAKTRFLALLSHELRNPLAALTSGAEILCSGGPLNGRAGAAAQVIKRQTMHMARMVEDLLDISLITTGRLHVRHEPFDLAELVQGTVQSWQDTGRLRDREISIHTDRVWAKGDAHRTEQIVCNLLDNAIKFTRPNGEIEIRLTAADDNALLVVSDNGAGLPAELMARVFEPFVQGEQGIDRRSGGMGLGLALVKSLAELQEGSATVESAGRGQGTKFTVSLPSAPESAVPREPQRSVASGSRILLVEDNEDARQSLRTLLELNGHQVLEAANGRNALALARQLRPEVALVDIGLPDIDGYQVARGIRSWSGGDRTMLVAVTGYGQPEDRRKALEAGFDAHLVKPITIKQLDAVLKPCAASA